MIPPKQNSLLPPHLSTNPQYIACPPTIKFNPPPHIDRYYSHRVCAPPPQYRTACPLKIKFTPFPCCTYCHILSMTPAAQLGSASPSSLEYDPSHPNIDAQLCATMLKAYNYLYVNDCLY